MMRVIPTRDYITVALLRFCYLITFNVLPFIIWYFLKSVTTASEISYKATMSFVVGISLAAFGRSVCTGHGIIKSEMISTRLKVATIGLVYKKASIYLSLLKTVKQACNFPTYDFTVYTKVSAPFQHVLDQISNTVI